MNTREKMLKIFDDVPAADYSYNEWVRMLAAAKNSGLTTEEVEAWSAQDSRYKRGDVAKRWRGFNDKVGTATAVFLAKQHGFVVPEGWSEDKFEVCPNPLKGNASDAYIEKINRWAAALPKAEAAIGEEEFGAMLDGAQYDRANMAVEFLNAVYSDFDVVGLCRTFEVDNSAGETLEQRFVRVGELKQWIKQGHDDYDFGLLANVTNEALRQSIEGEHTRLPLNILVNPVKPNSDNKYSAKVEQIASYRHILVECDTLPPYEQFKILTAVNLPISSIVYSGNKSLHALVKVDAKTLEEYRERFEFIRDVCAAYGMQIDEACKNVNRWSRMAAALRGWNCTQTLIGTHYGADTFEAWREKIDAELERAEYEAALKAFGIHATTLPELVKNPPENVPQIIQNALKKGREGILIASSKCGKSWLCLKLAVACAEGGRWLGYKCNPCRVGVVNMELGEDDIFERMELIAPNGVKNGENIFFLNCAGVCSDLKTLRTTFERFVKHNKLDLLIVDPVYSLMGELEENSNGDVMQFLETLAAIRKTSGCATFMTHHTSKGSQDGKASIDMGSGAGTWARHPDMIVIMQTATEENLKGLPQEVIREELDRGINYFVLNETLRSFKSTRKSEVWRADFPDYMPATGLSYDRMGAAHSAKVGEASSKWSKAIADCAAHGLETTPVNVATVAGMSPSAARKYKHDHKEDWAALGGK